MSGLCRLVSQLDDLDVAGLGIQFGPHMAGRGQVDGRVIT